MIASHLWRPQKDPSNLPSGWGLSCQKTSLSKTKTAREGGSEIKVNQRAISSAFLIGFLMSY